MKEKGFSQMKFVLYIFHVLKKFGLIKVAMDIFTAKRAKCFHLVTPKNMSYSEFNSISSAQLFQTNKYSIMFTIILKIN